MENLNHDNRYPDRVLSPEPPESEADVLTTRPWILAGEVFRIGILYVMRFGNVKKWNQSMLAEHNSPGAFALVGQIIPVVCVIREHLSFCLNAMNSFYSCLQVLIILRS